MEKAFRVPDAKERKQAIGALAGSNFALRKLLEDAETFWEPKVPPKAGDWLWDHYEPGQDFDQYRTSYVGALSEKRKTIYILPLNKSIDKAFLR